jgi:hypothetical protein
MRTEDFIQRVLIHKEREMIFTFFTDFLVQGTKILLQCSCKLRPEIFYQIKYHERDRK